MQALTADEEKQARKVEKKLREIAALEARLAEGETLQYLQKKKVDKKSEFEDCEVMRKLRSGYTRCDLPAKSLIEAGHPWNSLFPGCLSWYVGCYLVPSGSEAARTSLL